MQDIQTRRSQGASRHEVWCICPAASLDAPKLVLLMIYVFSFCCRVTFFQTGVTTTVRTHLVKRIGTGTIDQAEDPRFTKISCMEATRTKQEKEYVVRLSSHHLHMTITFPWQHCFTPDFVTCNM